MSKEITIREIQIIIADLNSFSQSFICPDWDREMVVAMANLLEHIITNRESA